jgi:drug/metabolite transporter (DMT)-like permease
MNSFLPASKGGHDIPPAQGMAKPGTKLYAAGLLVFLIIVACLTPVFAKLTVAEISPLSLGFIRFGSAAVLFYITAKVYKVKLVFERKDYPLLFLLAVLVIPLNQFFFLTGIKNSYASHSGIIYSLNPVYAYVLAIMIKSEQFRINKIISIALTVAGIVLVFYEGISRTTLDQNVLGGDFLLLFAVLTFSMYLTFGKKLIDKYGALKVSTFAFVWGSVFNIPAFIYDLPNFTLSNLTYKGITGFIFLVIVSYLGYFAWYYALKTNEVSKITTINNVAPVLTVLISVLFLSEPISFYFIIGGIITLIGVFLMHRATVEII